MTTHSPSFAAGAPASRVHRPSGLGGVSATVRSFLMLLGIEIRRSQGYWLLPVMIGIALYSSSFRSYDEPGLTLWVLVNASIMQAYVVIGALAAALGAWLADRERRRRLGGLLESVPASPFRRDLVTAGVAAFWGLAGYAIVAGWYGGQAFVEATWGGPDLPLIATGTLAIVFFAAIGVLAGRVLPNKVTPIIVFVLALMATVVSDYFKVNVTVSDPYGNFDRQAQPFKLLMPWGLVDSYPDVFFDRPADFTGYALLWLAGATGVVLALLALRKQRNLVTWVALVVTVAVAAAGAAPLIDRQVNLGLNEAPAIVPFKFVCQQREGFEICLHPAYSARLDNTADRVGAMFSPVRGLAGVPMRWEQAVPMEGWKRETIGVIDQVGNDYALNNAIITIFQEPFTQSGFPQWPASQLVIMQWLLTQSDSGGQLADWFGAPAEVPIVEVVYGDDFVGSGPDEAALAAFQPKMDAALARFAALPEGEQRTWLELNWNALRAGELTLEDLP